MSNYQLLLTPRSPFARRARLALVRAGVPFELKEVSVFDPVSPVLIEQSPLATVPVLILPSGEAVPDSAAILEYLHEEHGQKIWPASEMLRRQVRSASVWAEGIMAATVGYYLDSLKPLPPQEWMQDSWRIVERTFQRILAQGLEQLPWRHLCEPTQAGWDLAVAAEYAWMRLPGLEAARDPQIVTLVEQCRKLPAFRESTPPPPA